MILKKLRDSSLFIDFKKLRKEKKRRNRQNAESFFIFSLIKKTMANIMNMEKFSQLKLLTDLKTAGSLTDARFKDLKKENDKLPDLVPAPSAGSVDGSGKKTSTIEDATVTRRREMEAGVTAWIGTIDKPTMDGVLYEKNVNAKGFADSTYALQLAGWMGGNALNRRFWKMFEEIEKGETPEVLKVVAGEPEERKILRLAVREWLRGMASDFGASLTMQRHTTATEGDRADIRKQIYESLEDQEGNKTADAIFKTWKKDRREDVPRGGGGGGGKRERSSSREPEENNRRGGKPQGPNWTENWKPTCEWCKKSGHWASKCEERKKGVPKK